MLLYLPLAALALGSVLPSTEARSWGSLSWGRAREHARLIDERKLPITATTTVTVVATRTNTVWVPGAVTPYPSASIPANNETVESTSSSEASATETAWTSSVATESAWQSTSTELPSRSATATASASSTAEEQATGISTISGTQTLSFSSVESTVSAYSDSSFTASSSSSFLPSGTAPYTSVWTIASETLSSWTSISEPIETPSSSQTASQSQQTNSAESSAFSSNVISSEASPTRTFTAVETNPVLTELENASTVSESASTATASVTNAAQSSAITLAASSFESSAAETASASGSSSDPAATAYVPDWTAPADVPDYPTTTSSSESSSDPTASAYVPDWNAPGNVPDYPTTASATASAPSSQSSEFSASETVSRKDSSTDTASATARSSAASSATYVPDWEPPASIPLYTTSVLQTATESIISSATATGSNSLAPQPTPTEFSSTTESASTTASSWWSSFWSQSSATDTASSSETLSATETTSAFQSASGSETATSESSLITAPTSTIEASTSSASESVRSSTAAPVPTGGSMLSTTILPERMTSGYYPDWSVWTFPVSQIDWSKLDLVEFAFAIPNSNFELEFTQYNSLETLSQLVAAGHAAGKKVSLSIGGWTGSVYFSPAVSTPWGRQTFADNIAKVYNQYNLDGINIDNEYWGVKGADGNIFAPEDSANFLLWLDVLRRTLPPSAIISAATQVWPFAGPDGNPLADVSGFAKYLDHITIMNYDVFSVGDPGPNAPLSDGCGTSSMKHANAYAAVSAWTSAGMPANQIMLGIAAYGYLYKSSASRLRTRRRGIEPRASVTVLNPNGWPEGGQVNFASLISQGALARDETGKWVGAGGFTREWDNCSNTPWLKSWESGQIISYDDPDSISLKAQFSRQVGLRGASVWEITGDMGPAEWSILSATRSGLGL